MAQTMAKRIRIGTPMLPGRLSLSGPYLCGRRHGWMADRGGGAEGSRSVTSSSRPLNVTVLLRNHDEGQRGRFQEDEATHPDQHRWGSLAQTSAGSPRPAGPIIPGEPSVGS